MECDYYVIFGAAVRPDGTSSGSLRRRVEGALILATGSPSAKFLVTGGVGRYGPAEAVVMKHILEEAGISSSRIITDCEATDTLSSILLCKNILDTRDDVKTVTVCSDLYHIPRCRLLFWMMGVNTIGGLMPSGRNALGRGKWVYYHIREVVAICWDALLLSGQIYRNNTKK